MPEDLRPNPNHQELLDKIPGELHPLVVPILKKWDQGVNDQFAKIRGEYDEYKPYKAFIDANLDPGFVQQAVQLVEQLKQDPKNVLEQINQNFDLGYVSKDALPETNPEEDLDFMNDDIFKDPRVKALADGLQQVQSQLKTQQEEDEQARALAEFEEELDTLEKKAEEDKLPFDRTFVMALVAQGYNGEDAVNQFHKILAAQGLNGQQQQTTEEVNTDAPAILGGSPAGSGLPNESVQFGQLSRNDLNNTVEQLLAQRAQSDQG